MTSSKGGFGYYLGSAHTQQNVSERAFVIFCHETQGRIEDAIAEFFASCNTRHKESDHKSCNVKDFSADQIKALKEKGKKHQFKIHVNTDIGRVKISGFGDVSKIHKKIAKIEADVEKMKKAALVDAMNTETRWQYKSGGSFKDFSNLANCHLEAELKKKKSETQVEIDNEEYTVNFSQMTATCMIDWSSFDVRRENRWDKGEPLPDYWDHMSSSENLKVVDLDPQSQDYKDVEQHFRKHGAKGTVLKIQRVQNRGLYQQYVAKKREIEDRNPPGHENEMLLFHGSDCNAVNAINQTGFNRSYCGKNATVFGLGVYFAESSAYSESYANPDDKNERKLYQARVLVGMAVETNRDTKFLPPQPGKNVPYDSGKAPPTRTEGIHIIFHDSQAYPEFIITFTLPANTSKA